MGERKIHKFKNNRGEVTVALLQQQCSKDLNDTAQALTNHRVVQDILLINYGSSNLNIKLNKDDVLVLFRSKALLYKLQVYETTLGLLVNLN